MPTAILSRGKDNALAIIDLALAETSSSAAVRTLAGCYGVGRVLFSAWANSLLPIGDRWPIDWSRWNPTLGHQSGEREGRKEEHRLEMWRAVAPTRHVL